MFPTDSTLSNSSRPQVCIFDIMENQKLQKQYFAGKILLKSHCTNIEQHLLFKAYLEIERIDCLRFVEMSQIALRETHYSDQGQSERRRFFMTLHEPPSN